MSPGGRGSRRQKEQSIHEIPVLLQCLTSGDADSNLREKALYSLADILWRSGEKARDFIIQYNGIETLVNAMFEDMAILKVQDAALHFLFSLAASSDGRASSDLLSNEEAICDALLFSMEAHPTVASIQLKGCSILACLASASSNNKKISDGTLSGAQRMVLNAICNHVDSIEIQKAGIQALYFQCSLSENAERNKRSLMESVLNGRSGIDVVTDAMMQLQDDIVAMEWAFRMCWCLTSSEDLVKLVSGEPMVMKEVMKGCQRHMDHPDAAALTEAAFGVFGNLAHLENVRSDLHQIGAVQTIVDGMRFHKHDYGVTIEACSAIANLSLSPLIRDSFLRAGAVATVLGAMKTFIDSPECVAEVTRALVCMVHESQGGKEQMNLPEVLDSIAQAASKHHDAQMLQEMSSTFIASIAVQTKATTTSLLSNGGANLMIRALEDQSSGQKVQDAAALALRNLSCQIDYVEMLLRSGAVNGIIRAMESNSESASIQTNGCCTLWNLICQSKNPPGSIVGQEGVSSIVKGMRCNMESAEVLEMACGTLWSIVNASVDRNKQGLAAGNGAIDEGAIDSVAVAMVMHPSRITTLEKACGVLANASLETSLAEAIVNAQAVSIVAEAMRFNSDSLSLLEIGCIALRNVVSIHPQCAQEASACVSVVVNAMQNNMDALDFQREACNLLWVLAAQAESCQSKILALDGVSVLMKCLEHNSADGAVNAAALGAFNQLASNNSTGQ